MAARQVAAVAVTMAALLGAAAAADREAPANGESSVVEPVTVYSVEARGLVDTERLTLSDGDWRRRLSPEQYQVVRRHGTEREFSGAFWASKQEGVYRCVACGNDLFLSTTKYDSGAGWPTFTAPVHERNVGTREDRTLWLVRIEVHCARCGAHLGHVSSDGPTPSGLRYSINSVALSFQPMAVEQDPPAATQDPEGS